MRKFFARESVDENEKIFFFESCTTTSSSSTQRRGKAKKGEKRRDETLGLWKRDYILLLQKEKKK